MKHVSGQKVVFFYTLQLLCLTFFLKSTPNEVGAQKQFFSNISVMFKYYCLRFSIHTSSYITRKKCFNSLHEWSHMTIYGRTFISEGAIIIYSLWHKKFSLNILMFWGVSRITYASDRSCIKNLGLCRIPLLYKYYNNEYWK